MDHYKSLAMEKVNQTNVLINLNLILLCIIESQIIFTMKLRNKLSYYEKCLYIC